MNKWTDAFWRALLKPRIDHIQLDMVNSQENMRFLYNITFTQYLLIDIFDNYSFSHNVQSLVCSKGHSSYCEGHYRKSHKVKTTCKHNEQYTGTAAMICGYFPTGFSCSQFSHNLALIFYYHRWVQLIYVGVSSFKEWMCLEKWKPK